MDALRRIFAITLADLRERTRSTRFWVVLGIVAVATWMCFPAVDSGQLAVSVDDARGHYSSAWVGLTLGLMYSTMLAWLGFYLVRGTVLRDFDTRVWQLLVATPMTRAGYLIAKWASHMAVFALVLALGLTVGVVAQLVRGEDRTLDIIELAKPVLVLTLPALSLTAFFAILFDMVPFLRRTIGNVLYFFVWLLLFTVMLADYTPSTTPLATQPMISDPSGMTLVQQAFADAPALRAQKIDATKVSVGMGDIKGRPRQFVWNTWHVAPRSLVGRALWLMLGLVGSAGLARFLDLAAARTSAATRPSEGAGRRLRWLDRVLRPLEHGALGTLVAAELRLALRRRTLLWWAVLLVAGIVQLAAPLPNAAIAAVVALMLGIDLHARALLREAETRTAGLVFTAPDAARRLSIARLASAVLLSLFAVTPLLLRSLLMSTGILGAVALAAVAIAVLGLACGALFRNPRPYEMAMVLLAYVGMQGAGPLAVAGWSPGMAVGVGVALAAGLALVFVSTPRLAAASARSAA